MKSDLFWTSESYWASEEAEDASAQVRAAINAMIVASWRPPTAETKYLPTTALESSFLQGDTKEKPHQMSTQVFMKKRSY